MVDLAGRIVDLFLAPLIILAGLPMRVVRKFRLDSLPLPAAALRFVGVFPIRNIYYEPLFDFRHMRAVREPRVLPGLDLNVAAQLALLSSFTDVEGPARVTEAATLQFEQNPNFWSGDAELWFHVINHFKPQRIIEIGSGFSTRMACRAISHVKSSDSAYRCEQICIEPFEMPWLEHLGVKVVRRKVEEVDLSIFASLAKDDILFIDSSHMIRPQGDVLLEILRIVPGLQHGVIVHLHDIFTPRDYPEEWIREPRFWNEQYLLEAFMTENNAWEVLLAANQLKHDHYDLLKAKCLWLTEDREPGSFYIRKL